MLLKKSTRPPSWCSLLERPWRRGSSARPRPPRRRHATGAGHDRGHHHGRDAAETAARSPFPFYGDPRGKCAYPSSAQPVDVTRACPLPPARREPSRPTSDPGRAFSWLTVFVAPGPGPLHGSTVAEASERRRCCVWYKEKVSCTLVKRQKSGQAKATKASNKASVLEQRNNEATSCSSVHRLTFSRSVSSRVAIFVLVVVVLDVPGSGLDEPGEPGELPEHVEEADDEDAHCDPVCPLACSLRLVGPAHQSS